MSATKRTTQVVTDAVARALCEQEESDAEQKWWGWSTDELSAFIATAVVALMPEADSAVSRLTRFDDAALRPVVAPACDGER